MSDMSFVTPENYEAIKAQRDLLLTQQDFLVTKLRDMEERMVAYCMESDKFPGWYGTVTSIDKIRTTKTYRFGPFASMVEAQAKLGEWMQSDREWIGFNIEYITDQFTIGDPDEHLHV